MEHLEHMESAVPAAETAVDAATDSAIDAEWEGGEHMPHAGTGDGDASARPVEEHGARSDAEWEDGDDSIPPHTAAGPEPVPPPPLTPLLSAVSRPAGAARRDAEVRGFLAAYPDVKPEDIPPAVWEQVRGGTPLTTAYTMERNRRLEAELTALRQNSAARAKTVGSMRTAGERFRDEFDEGWYED